MPWTWFVHWWDCWYSSSCAFFVLAPGICVHMVACWLTGGVGHSRNHRRAHEQTNYDVGRNDCYLSRNDSIPCLPFLYVENNEEKKNLVFGFCVRLFQCRTCTFNNFILTRRWWRRSQSVRSLEIYEFYFIFWLWTRYSVIRSKHDCILIRLFHGLYGRLNKSSTSILVC